MAPPLKNPRIHTMQSFKQRKACVFKKSRELSVLCGIKVCAIIVDGDGNTEHWPEDSDHVQELLKLKKDSASIKKTHSADQETPMKHNNDVKDAPEDVLKLIEEKLQLVDKKIELMRLDEDHCRFIQNSGIQCFQSPPLESVAGETLCGFDYETENSSMEWLSENPVPCNTNEWDAIPPLQSIVSGMLSEFEEFEAYQKLEAEVTSGTKSPTSEALGNGSFEGFDDLDSILAGWNDSDCADLDSILARLVD